MLAGFEIFPLTLDELVGLQFGVGLDLPDIKLPEHLVQVVHRACLPGSGR
jgi:hypothetical protein